MKLAEKLGFIGTTVSLSGIAFGWGLFPWLIKLQIGKTKGLAPGSESRGFWERVPFALTFKIHIFNVTNYMAVQQKGEKPEVEEIGPYYYQEWKEKAEMIDYEEDDSVTFHMKNTWFFDKEMTSPLTGDETVIIPNPILVGMITAVERDRAGILPLINKAIPILFNKPESIFLKTTVYDFLFGGIVFNCTTKDFAASAVCAVLKKEATFLEVVSSNVFKFSVLNLKNATNEPSKLQISRGIKDYSKVGQMISVNGKKKLSFWRGRPCNNLEGTDGTVFPPDISPEKDIVSYNSDLCRSVAAKFMRKSEYKSIRTLRYNASLGDMSSDPALKCFCSSDTSCWKRGVIDLLKCSGLPVIASLPHFYDSHEEYLTGVRGMNPNEEKHAIFLDIEPMTGTPLYAKKRIQFSFPVHKINKIDISQNLPSVLLPFLWVEESVEVPDYLIEKIDGELFRVLQFLDVAKWLLTVFGAALVSGGVGLYYKDHRARPVTVESTESQKPDFGAKEKTLQGNELGQVNLAFVN